MKSKKDLKKIPEEIQKVAEAHPGKEIEVWFEDEARLGQQGTITKVWVPRGTRPRVIRQTEYEYLYILVAANPAHGQSEALFFSTLDTEVINLFLKQLSNTIAPNKHVLLVLDQAGYHKSKSLCIPHNISLLYLPPYSPELNPVENLWHYLRSHYWSNRYYKDKNALEEAAYEAWKDVCLQPKAIATICAAPYVAIA